MVMILIYSTLQQIASQMLLHVAMISDHSTHIIGYGMIILYFSLVLLFPKEMYQIHLSMTLIMLMLLDQIEVYF